MFTETDLLRVVLALQMGFVSKEQVEDAVAGSGKGDPASLTSRLESLGHLKAEGRAAVDAYIVAKTEAYQETVNEIFASLLMDGDVEALHAEFAPYRARFGLDIERR